MKAAIFRNVAQVFETLKAQESTKQQEAKAKEAEFKAAAEKAAIVSAATYLVMGHMIILCRACMLPTLQDGLMLLW